MSAFLTLLADASGSIIGSANQTCTGVCNTSTTVGGIFSNVAHVLIFLVGAVAVIMIILGGLKYVTAGGDSKAVSSAKDTIMYSVIGLVVAIVSYAIVTFVATSIK